MRLNERTLLRNGLIIGAALLPAILYAIVVQQDRSSILDQAQESIQTTVQIFEANTHNFLETHVVIAGLINQRLRGMTWDEIAASKEIHEYLTHIAHDYPTIDGLWLIDSTARLRNSSELFPSPELSVSFRDYFQALRDDAAAAIYISKPVIGRVYGRTHINIAKRLGNGMEFDGVIVVTMAPEHFTDYWNKLPHRPGSAVVVRTDGQILAHDPPIPIDIPPLGQGPDKLMDRIKMGSDVGFFHGTSPLDQHHRLFGYRKVEGFPVYVGYGVNVEAALETWYQHLWMYGIFFVIGAVGLIAGAVLAGDRLQRWQEVALELSNEIAHREQTEAQLRQSQKLEALGQVAGQIAHDFGNILGVIVGSLDMLANKQGDREKFLGMAQLATERGIKAVTTLLAFARNQPELVETFDLNVALTGLNDLLCQAIGRNIMLDIVTHDTPCWIKASRNQTELAILNIVVNARDAMPTGGVITATVSIAGEFVSLAIADTGRGMPKEVMAKAFEPFYTTKQPGKGTGLGLSMVYNFAKQTQGHVEISSRSGEGTTITLLLPESSP